MIEVETTQNNQEQKQEQKALRPLYLHDLQKTNQKLVKVEIPGLDGFIQMRGLTGQESLDFEEANQLAEKKEGKEREEAELRVLCLQLAACCFDANGQRIFSENEEECYKQVMALPAALVKQLHTVWQQLTTIPDIAGLAKNLQAVTQGASSSVCVHC